jgi:ribosome-binding factor A
MTSRRLLKAASAIREVVSMAILTDLRDPRVRDVTVTRVEMTPDMRTAKVYVSVMGDETQQQLSLHGLRRAAGFLQQRLSDRIETRYTPRLTFILDDGVKQSIEIASILRQVLPPEPAQDEDQPDEDQPDDEMDDEDAAAEDTADEDRADEDRAEDDTPDGDSTQDQSTR